MKLATAFVALAFAAFATSVNAVNTTSGAPVYTASKSFPTGLFPSMYYMPKNMEQEPRPVITRVNGGAYPDGLTHPLHLPSGTPKDEALMPNPHRGTADLDQLIKTVWEVSDKLFRMDKEASPTCNLCRHALDALQQVARTDPDTIPNLLTSLCEAFNILGMTGYRQECKRTLDKAAFGGALAQVISYANFTENAPDALTVCSQFPPLTFCDKPDVSLSEKFLNDWFRGQRHASPDVIRRWREKRDNAYKYYNPKDDLRVVHLSDLHLDPRYYVGGESDCTWGATVACCHYNSANFTKFHGQIVDKPLPDHKIVHKANYWGSLMCDTPWSLMTSSMEAVKAMGGKNGYDLALFTGDLVVHDDPYRYSHDLVTYSEQAQYDLMKAYLGKTPLVPTLGNHDSSPLNLMIQSQPFPDGASYGFDWDLNYIAELWKQRGWIDDNEVREIKTHHGAFSVMPRKGLRVVSLNTDFWYQYNFYAYINSANPDFSGMLRFLTDELLDAEKCGDRVWIVGHVLTGWNGKEALASPTNLFYQIVSRFAPHTLGAIYFGHTHEDQFEVFYFNDNGNDKSTDQSTEKAVSIAYIAPSITPYQNLNPTFRVYSVHPVTYEIMDYDQYYASIPTFDDLVESKANHGPVWRKLYSARDAYGDFHASSQRNTYKAGVELDHARWPWNAPLNGTFWAAVTDEMEQRPELVQTWAEYTSSMSPRAKQCTSKKCQEAVICYMRSGSTNLGLKCNGDYSSFQ